MKVSPEVREILLVLKMAISFTYSGHQISLFYFFLFFSLFVLVIYKAKIWLFGTSKNSVKDSVTCSENVIFLFRSQMQMPTF